MNAMDKKKAFLSRATRWLQMELTTRHETRYSGSWLPFTLVVIGLSITVAFGDLPERAFELNMVPQPLDEALVELSEASDVPIKVSEEGASQYMAPPLDGPFTVREAIRALLVDTPLAYRVSDGNTIFVSKEADRDDELEKRESQTSQVAEDDKPVELPETVIRGEKGDYRAPRASAGTKTDTPVMETPRAVNVVPREVMDDQVALSLEESLRNVSGMTYIEGGEGIQLFSRGLGATTFKNSFPLTEFTDGDIPESDLDTYNIERIEVLKGPASVLYGRGNPGGTVNLITKKPQPEASYEIGVLGRSHSLIRPNFDLTGPLNEAGSIRYRLNGLYEDAESYRDRVESEDYAVSPSVAFDLGEQTTLRNDFEYFDREQTPDGGVPSSDGEIYSGVDNEDFYGEPTDKQKTDKVMDRVTLTHHFNEAWRLRATGRIASYDTDTRFTRPDGVLDDGRTASRSFIINGFELEDYRGQAELVGELETGIFRHRPLVGLEGGRRETGVLFGSAPADNIDIFNPTYGPGGPQGDRNFTFVSEGERDLFGGYLQDQISYEKEWHLVLGGRYDYVEQRVVSGLVGDTSRQPKKEDHAFSPNVGLVYRPVEPVSFYTSWSQSFQQQNGVPVNIDGEVLDPEEATLYEVGTKWSLMDDRLGGTLAFYHIDQENRRSRDLENPGFQKAFGEVESQGIELDVTGEILPGWNAIANYAFNDSEIVRETDTSLIGNRPKEIPEHTGRLWSTYQFQEGNLQGLGFGGGLTYVGDRPGNDANTFDLPDYSRLDATVFYRQPEFTVRLKLNNLLDKDDIVLNTARGSFVRPGAGFSVLASVDFRF